MEKKLLSDDRILRIAETTFGLHSADISDHIWTTFARAIERETTRIASMGIAARDLWVEVCNILPDGEFNPDKHVYLTQQQLAACVERVMERRAASPAALTDGQIRNIAARFQSHSDDGAGFTSFYSTNLERFARAILAASQADKKKGE